MAGVYGGDADGDRRSRGSRRERQRSRTPDLEDPQKGEIEAGELGREEHGGDGGAEDGASRPVRGESPGVVGVQVREEVGLAVLAPPVDRDQAPLHLPPMDAEEAAGGKRETARIFE